jgi:hypothetical protein
MNWHLPSSAEDFSDEYVREDLQRLIERFVKAGWTAGCQKSWPDISNLAFNKLGQERMSQLGEIAAFLIPKLFGCDAKNISAADSLRFMERCFSIYAELQPPPFSETESKLLLVVAGFYAREHPKE